MRYPVAFPDAKGPHCILIRVICHIKASYKTLVLYFFKTQSALAPPLFPSNCDSLRRVRSCLAALWAAFYMRGEINSNSPAHAGAKPPCSGLLFAWAEE